MLGKKQKKKLEEELRMQEKLRQIEAEEKERKEAKKKATKKMKRGRCICLIFALLCFIMVLGTVPSISAIVFAAMGVLLLPIRPIEKLWNNILKVKPKTRAVIMVVVFFLAGAFYRPMYYIPKTDNTANTAKQETVAEPNVTADLSVEPEVSAEPEEEPVVAEQPQTPAEEPISEPEPVADTAPTVSLDSIPAYSGSPYVVVNDNVPYFSDAELTTTAFEDYSSLDNLGRCGVAYANVCKEIMPTEERGAIGSVKPSGWHTVKYDVVSGKYLYNRCHLIDYQLSAENANTKNLITGTRYLNVEGMLPFENMVADYVEETNNHVLYRVTPVFAGDNLVASGVLMEAKSVEDNGAGILFNVYCYNVQPGVSIDYATGDSALDGTTPAKGQSQSQAQTAQSSGSSSASAGSGSSFGSGSNISEAQAPAAVTQPSDSVASSSEVMVHITNSGKKYHNAGCRYLKSDSEVTLEKAKSMGLEPCGVCNPPR